MACSLIADCVPYSFAAVISYCGKPSWQTKKRRALSARRLLFLRKQKRYLIAVKFFIGAPGTGGNARHTVAFLRFNTATGTFCFFLFHTLLS
ncbi:MAG: hypothetical protein COX54_00910 [Candidatus Yonathbacteria bacterium CG23_combo_of_CG06-09_8_20_14_all_46_18]|nr:MAG: hypothetical protein COX54_00910 [Candidatus Yonathbacteria bacterium CG23_combo_of_CG06-09_8_20_14_all_46_18]